MKREILKTKGDKRDVLGKWGNKFISHNEENKG